MRWLAAIVLLVLISACAGNPPASPAPTSPYRLARLDYLRLLADCLTESGFPSTFNPADESISGAGGLTVSQRDALREASTDCTRRIDPRRLAPPPPLTDSQWRARYAYLLAQVECLRDAGHDVADPPSLETWRESDAAWDPYAYLIEQGRPAPNTDILTCQDVEEKPDFFDW